MKHLGLTTNDVPQLKEDVKIYLKNVYVITWKILSQFPLQPSAKASVEHSEKLGCIIKYLAVKQRLNTHEWSLFRRSA
jgi:hypothetical protein